MFKAYKPQEEKIVLDFGGRSEAVYNGSVSLDDVPDYLHLDRTGERPEPPEKRDALKDAELLFKLFDL